MEKQEFNQKLFFENIDKKNAVILSALDPKLPSKEYNFRKDIKKGKLGETFIKNVLVYFGFNFIKFNDDNKYDLLMSYNGKEVKYEVKTDFLAETGNLFIEFECRGKDSGIHTSESDYYIFYFPTIKELWKIKTEKLKNIIKEQTFESREYCGDDNSKTKGYLIPRNKYKNLFVVYDVNVFPPKTI
jgi:hypothetical protein